MKFVGRILGIMLVLAVVAGVAFFTVGPGYFERGRNQVAEMALPDVSARAQALHDRLFVADLHADPLLWKRSVANRAKRGQLDLPRMIEGGMDLQVFSAVTQVPAGLNYETNSAESDQLTLLSFVQMQPLATWHSPLERALFQAGKLGKVAEADGSPLRIIQSQNDMRQLMNGRSGDDPMVGGLLALEGLHAAEGDLDNLQRLWDAGYRMGGLHHFFDNQVGGSLHGVSGEGLSDFGVELVRAMDAQGWIIDVAHSSPAVVEDVLALTSRPLVVSHTGFKGHCDTPRNIDDALMVRIAEAGGVIGQGFWDAAACDVSPAGIAKAIAYGVELVGEDHVGLGSDFDGAVTTAFDASQMAVLTQALLDEGLSEAQIEKIMGGNVYRVLMENLPAR